MQIPEKLLSTLKSYFDPSAPADEQGNEIFDEGFEGVHEWFMVGLWKEGPWVLDLYQREDGSYGAALYQYEPYDDAVFPDLKYGDDVESSQRLLEWIKTKPSTKNLSTKTA